MKWHDFVAQASQFSTQEDFMTSVTFPGVIYGLSEPGGTIDEESDTPERTILPKRLTAHLSDSTRLDLHKKQFPFDLSTAELVFLDRGKNYVGRDKDCKVKFNIPQLSRKHAYFWSIDDGGANDTIWCLMDNMSKNGTFINRHRTSPGQPFVVKDRDILTFSRVYAGFYVPASLWILAKNILDMKRGRVG